MKSAYELAMERLQKEAPQTTKPLSTGQKQALKDTDTRFRAKIAEREIFLTAKIAEARAQGNAQEAHDIEVQLKNERARLEEEREEEKEKIRRQD